MYNLIAGLKCRASSYSLHLLSLGLIPFISALLFPDLFVIACSLFLSCHAIFEIFAILIWFFTFFYASLKSGVHAVWSTLAYLLGEFILFRTFSFLSLLCSLSLSLSFSLSSVRQTLFLGTGSRVCQL